MKQISGMKQFWKEKKSDYLLRLIFCHRKQRSLINSHRLLFKPLDDYPKQGCKSLGRAESSRNLGKKRPGPARPAEILGLNDPAQLKFGPDRPGPICQPRDLQP